MDRTACTEPQCLYKCALGDFAYVGGFLPLTESLDVVIQRNSATVGKNMSLFIYIYIYIQFVRKRTARFH